MMSTFGLDRVLAPRSVAVIGGSPRPSSLGVIVLQNIVNVGFAGEIAVVSPKHAPIGVRNTCPNLDAVPFVPDLVVITAPAPAIPGILDAAGKRGVGGAVIISSGLGHGAGSITERAAQTARRH